MSTDRLYVVRWGEGGISIDEMTDTELAKALKPHPDGPGRYINNFGVCPTVFASELPESLEHGEGVLVIRGHAVVPRPVEVATTYEVPK